MGCVGTYLGWGNLQESKADLKALHAMNGNNIGRYRIMRVIAYGHYRNDLFRIAKHITVLAIGIIACVIPKAPGQQAVTPTGLVITVGLFSIVLLIIMASALDKRQRDALDEMDEARFATEQKELDKNG